MSASVRVIPWSEETREAFFRLHCEEKEAGWCHCVAWWVPTWEGWGERTAEENRSLREQLCDAGAYDGFLAYVDGEDAPVGWCQAGARDRLEKLVRLFDRPPDPQAWAVTCFQVDPAYRRRGVARALLEHALQAAMSAGATAVEAFPRSGTQLDPGELWTGPEALFLSVGFVLVEQHARGPILRWTPPSR